MTKNDGSAYSWPVVTSQVYPLKAKGEEEEELKLSANNIKLTENRKDVVDQQQCWTGSFRWRSTGSRVSKSPASVSLFTDQKKIDTE